MDGKGAGQAVKGNKKDEINYATYNSSVMPVKWESQPAAVFAVYC